MRRGGAIIGDGTVHCDSVVRGSTSGTNGGGALLVQNGVSTVIAIGNKSAVLGGAYDATPLLYGNATIETNIGLAVGGALSATSGMAIGGATADTGGITFPATQVASSNANTLDDYEEGTWTPTQGAGLTVVGTFSSSGSYTKVGRLVTVEFTVTGSTSLAILSDQLLTANLPFAAGGTSSVGGLRNANNSIAQGVQISTTSVYITGPNIAATASLTVTATYSV